MTLSNPLPPNLDRSSHLFYRAYDLIQFCYTRTQGSLRRSIQPAQSTAAFAETRFQRTLQIAMQAVQRNDLATAVQCDRKLTLFALTCADLARDVCLTYQAHRPQSNLAITG
ncbi:MAG: hypothetical protein S4CHLAM2_00070 [Chlamydiales bacterium]|nr:hypothetical protein [Chlamydiales bacterium]